MASGGGEPLWGKPSLPGPGRRSWANVVKPKDDVNSGILAVFNQRQNLEKLKKSINEVVLVGKEMKDMAIIKWIIAYLEYSLGKLHHWNWSGLPGRRCGERWGHSR